MSMHRAIYETAVDLAESIAVRGASRRAGLDGERFGPSLRGVELSNTLGAALDDTKDTPRDLPRSRSGARRACNRMLIRAAATSAHRRTRSTGLLTMPSTLPAVPTIARRRWRAVPRALQGCVKRRDADSWRSARAVRLSSCAGDDDRRGQPAFDRVVRQLAEGSRRRLVQRV